jgi:hypothetical protein
VEAVTEPGDVRVASPVVREQGGDGFLEPVAGLVGEVDQQR